MKLFISILLILASPALGVQTSYWTQTTEGDFKSGTLDNVVASNLGDLKLARAVKVLFEQEPRISSVSALADAPDGTLYAGTGPHGVLLAVKGEKVSPILDLGAATHIFALIAEKSGALLVGTGGKEGRILRIDKPGEKPREIFRNDKVQYVWAMAQTSDGNVYAATGPEGQLFEIKPDGSKKVLLDTDENNLLSLISDGKDTLYVGSDPHGLVYRVNRKTGESFVLYNANESEIAALALDAHGNLYAATAEAKEGLPARLPGVEEERGGRPESAPSGTSVPANPPRDPSPPPPPDNDPARPNPIPRSTMRSAPIGLMGRTIAWSRRGAANQWRPAIPAFSALAVAGPAGLADAPADKSKRRPPRPGPAPSPEPNPGPTPPKPDPRHPPGLPQSPTTSAVHRPPPIDTGDAGEANAEGNAVYRIDPEGFVTEVFRQNVLIFAMVENNGSLLLATGNDTEGQVFQIRPDADETLVLAKVDAKQILTLLPGKDGSVYMGMANEGSLALMTQGFAAKGTFISPVLDGTQISRFGKMQLHGTLPTGTTLTVATRSGNVKDAQDKGWSNWSNEAGATEFMAVAAHTARFLQYRLTLNSIDGKSTPVVEDVTVAYQIPNLPPKVSSIRLAAGEGASVEPENSGNAKASESNARQTLTWEASDPNGDTLTYSLYFRRVGESQWMLLKDQLKEATFEWNTRTVADGRYEVRVTASDAASNPPGQGKTASRTSDPVLVDNTPPAVGDLHWKAAGDAVQINLRAVDHTSTVAAVEYSVDSQKDWQLVLPADGIYDSPEEAVEFTIHKLPAGPHQISLRATDVKGNQAFENLTVTVAAPK